MKITIKALAFIPKLEIKHLTWKYPILHIKEIIYELTKIPINSQKLLYNNMLLEDSKQLGDYSIYDDEILYLRIL